MIRCCWFVVLLNELSADSSFLFELHDRAKEVPERIPVEPIDLVHLLNKFRVIETIIAKKFTNVGPIFLFNVRIVVFLVL